MTIIFVDTYVSIEKSSCLRIMDFDSEVQLLDLEWKADNQLAAFAAVDVVRVGEMCRNKAGLNWSE